VTDTALITDNYSIPGLVISAVDLDASKTVATLTTSDQAPITGYTLTVNDVVSADLDEVIAPNSSVAFKSVAPFDFAINFTGGNPSGAGNHGGSPTFLDPSDVAGVQPTAGWYNVSGSVGRSTLLNNVPVNFIDGSATPVTLSFVADEEWTSGTSPASPAVATPNQKLFDGYFGFANGDHTISDVRPLYVQNVPEGNYSLIVYSLRDGSGEPESITINNNPDTTLHVKSQGAADWGTSPTFVRGVSTDINAPDLCNYVQFDNVQPVAGTITIDARSEFFRSPVNGIQLIYTDFLPITITTQPQSISVVDGTLYTFTATAIGSGPRTIQWFSNDVAIAGANSLSYTAIAHAYLDGSTFKVEVSNGGSDQTSDPATLTVTFDTVKPTIVDSGCDLVNHNGIRLTFSEPVTTATATDPGNYAIDGGLSVNTATLLADNKTVLLTLSDVLVPNSPYQLTVQNIQDLAFDPNTMDTAIRDIVGCVCSNGFVLVEMYRGDSGPNNFQTMTNNPKFPNSPDIISLQPSSHWDQTPNAIFTGGNEENYALVMKGFVTAPLDGNYVFQVHADDSAQLFLSTDGTKGNLQNIIYAPGDCGACTPRNSGNVPLLAGKTYYFEASFQEGGGGDYLELRWTPPGGVLDYIPPANLQWCIDPLKEPPLLITDPASVVTTECRDVTFTASVSGVNPGSKAVYQWRRSDAGGPFIDIPGANGPSYTLVNVQQSDNGAQFTFHVSVILQQGDSNPAILTVNPDLDVPLPVYAVGDNSLHKITVLFSEPMDVTFGSAEDPAAYQIVGEDQSVINISGSPAVVNGSNVVITTVEPLTPGLLYTVTVGTDFGDPYDRCFVNLVPIGSTISFHAWAEIPCTLTFQTYGQPGTAGGIAGNLVTDLTSNPLYPDHPRETLLIHRFGSREGYPDDSHEAYGGRMWGYIIPPITGNFTFYLMSDDGGQLLMNTNNVGDSRDPAGAVSMTLETGCCNPFAAHTTASVTLNAGQRYYVAGLWKEGGGGDHLEIAAKLTADPTDPNTLPTIPPEYLATLVDIDANPNLIPTLPTAHMIPSGSYDANTLPRGFDAHIVQVGTNIDNLLSIAEELLAGLGGQNLATVSDFIETGVVNYSVENNTSYGSIPNDKPFPGIPGTGSQPTDNIAMEVLTWVELAPGYHCMIVNSDDGFRVTAAMCAADPNNSIVLGQFDGGRGATDTTFVFNAPAAGLYPMRLIWEQGGGGGNVEWVKINPGSVQFTGSARVAVNDNGQFTGGVARAFRLSGRSSLAISPGTGGANLSWNPGLAPCAFRLQGTAVLANPSSATVWTDIAGSGTAFVPNASGLQFFRLINP